MSDNRYRLCFSMQFDWGQVDARRNLMAHARYGKGRYMRHIIRLTRGIEGSLQKVCG